MPGRSTRVGKDRMRANAKSATRQTSGVQPDGNEDSEEDVMVEGESPAGRWIREYNAELMSLDQLADKIAGYKFKERKGKNSKPTMGRALDYKNADSEVGTFDDVYQAQAFGLLTKKEMQTILERVEQVAASSDQAEPSN